MITTENVLDVDFDAMRKELYGLVRSHDASLALDRQLYTSLLGEYPALYQYFSEVYTFLIGEVRKLKELHDPWRAARAMDKRDCLKELLTVVKFQYDGLSRKVTVLDMEGEDG
jgi:hypothetical protein